MVDHIVYACKDLDQGMEEIYCLLGAEAVYGGKHTDFGTHNALIGLGPGCYFEIIAPDPTNQKVVPPRWMGVDLLKAGSRITRWAVKTEKIQEAAAGIRRWKPELGHVVWGRRQRADGTMLEWQLTRPQPDPMVEVLPFYIAWNGEVHPSSSLRHPCRLTGISLTSTYPAALNGELATAFPDVVINQGVESRIAVTIQCPNGVVRLS